MPKDEQTLTNKQRQFIELLTDEKGDCFLSPVKAMEQSGYKSGGKSGDKKQIAARVLSSKTILYHLLQTSKERRLIADIRQETAKERIWRELEAALTDCKAGNDMTNRLRVIDMMGKFHQLWSDKNVVSIEVSRQLSDSYLKELRELSKLSMSGSVIDAELSDQSVATRLLQGQSGVVSSPCDIQDVVSSTDRNDHNSDDIDKSSNDKDLYNQ